jgi:hypothetical protein
MTTAQDTREQIEADGIAAKAELERAREEFERGETLTAVRRCFATSRKLFGLAWRSAKLKPEAKL